MKEKFDNKDGKVIKYHSDGNVIDLKDEFMNRMVEKDAVKFIPVGESGNNYCITLSKNALIALREGKTFPIELMAGENKKTFVLMRDITYKRRVQMHNNLSKKAKSDVEEQIKMTKETESIGEGIGNGD